MNNFAVFLNKPLPWLERLCGMHLCSTLPANAKAFSKLILLCGSPTRTYIILHCVWAQSRLMLCGSLDYSSWGFSVHGIFQERILEWVVIYSSRGSSWPKNRTHISCVSCLGRQVLYQLCHLGSWWLPGHTWMIIILQLDHQIKLSQLQTCPTMADVK